MEYFIRSGSGKKDCGVHSCIVTEFWCTNELQVYIEMNQPVMAASLCLELGNALKVKLLSLRINDPELFFGVILFFFKQMMEIMIRCYSPVFLNRRWIDQERLLFIIRGLQSYRRKHPSKLCCRWEKWPRVKSSPVSSVGSDWVAAVCLLCRQDLTWLLCLWVCITCVFMIFFFLFQVIMTVLCQCSQRCSWSVRRKDCSYQAPSPLLVSIW